jgi:hypothetical protein
MYDKRNQGHVVWKHRGLPASLRSFQTVRGQARTFELLAVNPQLATSPMNSSNGTLVTVPVVWRTFRMKNSLPSAAKRYQTSSLCTNFRQILLNENLVHAMLCKNDANYARRAAPSWSKSPSLVEIVCVKRESSHRPFWR